jgi:hypothetical protein
MPNGDVRVVDNADAPADMRPTSTMSWPASPKTSAPTTSSPDPWGSCPSLRGVERIRDAV